MPFRLINDLKELISIEFEQPTNEKHDLTSFEYDIGDEAYDQLDRVLNSAQVLMSGKSVLSQRHVNELHRSGYPTKTVRNNGGSLVYLVHTPKGTITLN